MAKTVIRSPITLKSPEQIALMREAGRIVARTLVRVALAAKPGVTTADLDRMAEQMIRDHGAVPSFKGYRGYPASLCTSINDEIVHGIPSEERVLRDGDLVKLDCGAIYRGWQGDAALTVAVGRVSKVAQRLIADTQAALRAGVDATRAGCRVGDIGQVI